VTFPAGLADFLRELTPWRRQPSLSSPIRGSH
jgi:hypothetical protein